MKVPRWLGWTLSAGVGVIAAGAVAVGFWGPEGAYQALVLAFSPSYPTYAAPTDPQPTFDGRDATRARVAVGLKRLVSGLSYPTEIQAVPGHSGTLVVLEKQGRAVLVDPAGSVRPWFSLPVESRSEMGLLGISFAPEFPLSGVFYVHHNPPDGKTSVVSTWQCARDLSGPKQVSVVLTVDQPYANHDGGHLLTSPDGLLWIALGDGGYRDDPHGHGQNGQTLLGSILRVRPRTTGGYDIPPDNPFVHDPSVHDAIFALGARNPWKMAFDLSGRLLLADVGQNQWEEVNLVPAGANLGWNLREGRHAFREGPAPQGLVEPIWEYGHDEGASITGGIMYMGSKIPSLTGKYLVGDFVSGRLWAVPIPDQPGTPVEAVALGRWPLQPSTFGRDHQGEALVADFGSGTVWRIVAAE
jgi:glucose/arabinose dehydrogenase